MIHEPEETKAIPLTGQNVSLPRRKRDTHKGDYGRVVIVGGSIGYTGAPCLAAEAAVRAGAGLVWLGVPEAIWTVCAVKSTEAMPFPLPCDGKGMLTPEAADELERRWGNMDVLALGPGLGRSDDTVGLTRRLIERFPGVLVLDADALWAAARDPDMLLRGKGRIVITPHTGEFARLGGAVTGRRIDDAGAFADRYGCVTVLKGPGTVVAFPHGDRYVLQAGNPGMAKGGSGDVLTGVTAAMLGQLPMERAVLTAVWLHSAAGDACARKLGEYGMIPSDIIRVLPSVMKGITE